MAIVAMLICESTEHDSQTPEQGNAKFRAVTDKEEQHKKFFAYTPYAELAMGILNADAFSQLTPGKTYRMTLEQVD